MSCIWQDLTVHIYFWEFLEFDLFFTKKRLQKKYSPRQWPSHPDVMWYDDQGPCHVHLHILDHKLCHPIGNYKSQRLSFQVLNSKLRHIIYSKTKRRNGGGDEVVDPSIPPLVFLPATPKRWRNYIKLMCHMHTFIFKWSYRLSQLCWWLNLNFFIFGSHSPILL